jgi:glycosyltransferase involved in cell wall biosynthesis
MRLLILSHNPDRASFRQRIGIYLPYLPAEGVAYAVEKSPSNGFARWRLFSKAGEFDAVLLHKNILNFWEAYVLRKYARKIIFDFDDAVMVNSKRPDDLNLSHRRLFERTAGLADCVIAGNAYLAEHAKPFCRNVHILPTGLDTKKYDIPKPASDGKIRLVWIGSKATLGYLQAMTPVLEQIGEQYPNVVLRIICDAFLNLSKMSVERCVWSLATEAKDLAACDIGLCPLPDDNFTRGKCGFKILQYFAAGLPAVASPVGVNVDLIQAGKTGFPVQTEQEWGDALKKLIENPDLRKTMGQTAKEFSRQFDHEQIAPQFCKLITQAGRKA